MTSDQMYEFCFLGLRIHGKKLLTMTKTLQWRQLLKILMTLPSAQMNVQILLFGKVRVFATAIFLGDILELSGNTDFAAG